MKNLEVEAILKFYKDIDELRSIHQYQDSYTRKMDARTRKFKYARWKNAIKATRMFKLLKEENI